jgi:hypothetical protein
MTIAELYAERAAVEAAMRAKWRSKKGTRRNKCFP